MDLTRPWRRRGAGEVVAVLVMAALILAAAAWYTLQLYFAAAGVAPGVYFLGHDLGGLQSERALERIEQVVASTYAPPVYLKHRDRIWILRYGEHYRFLYDTGHILLDALEIGRRRSVVERVGQVLRLDYPHVDLAWLPTIDRDFSSPNIARSLSKVSRARIFAAPSSDPGLVDVTILSGDMAVLQVVEALEGSFRAAPLLDHRVVELDRLEKAGDMRTVPWNDPEYGFANLLAEGSSRFDPNDPPRAANVALCVERLQNRIVNPGEIFSFNDVVGDRSAAAGFQEVAVLTGGTVETTFERGARQVATTLYKPVLEAGLRIVERSHSLFYTPLIDYCQPGLEATVTTGGQDLKFQNTLDAPLALSGEVRDGSLTVRIHGIRPMPYRVELRPGRQQKISYETKIQKDPSLRRGLEVIDETGLDGYAVKVFRTFLTMDGTKFREELVNDRRDEYLAKPSIVRVGIGDGSFVAPALPPPSVPRTVPATDPDEPDFIDLDY